MEGQSLIADASAQELDRYVLPVDHPTPVDANGFLNPPPVTAWGIESGARPRHVLDLVGRQSSFVLLAAGGVGKSTVLRGLQDREAGVDVDLRVLDKSGMRDQLMEAVEAKAPVYLDALDEAALYESAVFRVVQRHLAGAMGQDILWRLSCRPAAWNAELAETLKASLPGFEELRLLPLTRSAACDVAASVGADPERFLEALTQANLGRLAASPMRLRAAARQWSRTGYLPTSHVEAIEFEIGQLLAEASPGRPQASLPADRLRGIAGRLGAISVFTGVGRFSAVEADGVLRVSELPSLPEPDEPGRQVETAHYQEVLGTALFDASSNAAVSFRHQQYAEYLAANYLVRRTITPAQLPALLGVHLDGLLPGVMAGVATWLAALTPDLAEDLVRANALGFAQAGVELPSHEVRAAIVEGLLSGAAAGDIDVAWGLDLTGLAYPELEKQLARHVEAGILRPEQVWWISRLAVAGGCNGLIPTLQTIIVAPGWPSWARSAGVDAVAALGDDAACSSLLPLLQLGRDEDPDDDLLASTVEAFYPRLLNTAEILQALRPRRMTNLIGSYFLLLGKLAQQLPIEDLPAVLEWATGHVGDGEGAYGQLLPELVVRGWDNADSALVRASLAGLVAAMAREFSWYHRARGGEVPWENGDAGRRQQLAIAVAEHLGGSHWYELLDLQLVQPGDLHWLIAHLPGLPVPTGNLLANCLPSLLHQPNAEEADLILSLPPDHPAYGATDWLRQPLALDSEMAKRWRQHRAVSAEHRAETNASREERQIQISSTLNEAEADPSLWWRIALWLSVEESGHVGDALFSADLTARPGWLLLDEHERQRVLDIGLRYLDARELQPTTWMGSDTAGDEAIRDWSGTYLLTTLTCHDPERVRDLEISVWRRWAPAIVGAWTFERPDDDSLRCDLVDMAPPDGRAAILTAALDNLDALAEQKSHLAPHRLYEHLCRDLTPTLAQRLIDGRYHGEIGRSVLGVLVGNAPEVAFATCKELRANPGSDLSSLARRFLAELDATATVDDLVRIGATASELIEVVPAIRLDLLDEARLASTGRLLLDRFPFADDPPIPTGAYRIDDEYKTREARLITIDLLTQQGLVQGLEMLLQNRPNPDRDIIASRLRTARTRAADLAFTRPQSAQLLDLLGRHDARLVRHSGDLRDVLVEQLGELQHEIQHNGAFRDLWNLHQDETSHPKSEDDISDWVRRQLTLRFRLGCVVDREVQVERRRAGGIGTRIDLAATAPTATHPVGTARVIVEAKLVNNRALMTAMHDQLGQRYLRPAGLQDGIYLIYWISPDQRPADWSQAPTDPDALMKQLEQQSTTEGEGLHIRAFLLDISQPL